MATPTTSKGTVAQRANRTAFGHKFGRGKTTSDKQIQRAAKRAAQHRPY